MASDNGTLSTDDIMDMQFLREPINLGRPLEEYTQLYEEKRVLGIGGMGEVFLVKRKSDGVLFAAKKQNDPIFHSTFIEELEMMQKIRHENVVSLVESFHSKEKKELIIIIEYCHCKSFQLLCRYYML